MTKPSNTEAIEKTTGCSWERWVKFLENKGAKDLQHRQIADLAYEELKDKLENAGWWAQSVAVAYEQHIGRRVPGQRSDGTFEVAVSKTMPGSINDAMAAWQKLIVGRKDFNKIALSGEPSTTGTEKYKHWAQSLKDDTRVNADVWPKPGDKVALTITHTKLSSKSAQEAWRAYWKSELEKI